VAVTASVAIAVTMVAVMTVAVEVLSGLFLFFVFVAEIASAN
jgi:hypothetical protein